ncbi:MAG: hypothetical protein Q9191_000970 [Dirinaria sp. TL-2023a]
MHYTSLLALSFLSLAGSSLGCSTVGGIKFTAYGWPDANQSPAYRCNGNKVLPPKAGSKTELGDGSFKNPYAAAASGNSIFGKCELLYMPLLKKYFRVQDDCGACDSHHTDLYIAQANKNIGQHDCELQFGDFDYSKALHEVVRNPGAGFATNTQPLFANGKCYNKPSDGRVFPDRDGHVQCGSNGQEVDTTEDVDGTADLGEINDPANNTETDTTSSAKASATFNA